MLKSNCSAVDLLDMKIYEMKLKEKRRGTLKINREIRLFRARNDEEEFQNLMCLQQFELRNIFKNLPYYDQARMPLLYALAMQGRVLSELKQINSNRRWDAERAKMERERKIEREKMIPSILYDFTQLPFCQPVEHQQQTSQHVPYIRNTKRSTSCSY